MALDETALADAVAAAINAGELACAVKAVPLTINAQRFDDPVESPPANGDLVITVIPGDVTEDLEAVAIGSADCQVDVVFQRHNQAVRDNAETDPVRQLMREVVELLRPLRIRGASVVGFPSRSRDRLIEYQDNDFVGVVSVTYRRIG